MTKNYLLSAFVFLLFSFQMAFSQNTWYVSPNGSGDGTSWASASRSLQTVIDNAEPGDQIWLKEGTYQRGVGLSFSINKDVSVYGGFPNTANPTMNDRNPRLYETILKGNQNRVLEVSGVLEQLLPSTIIDGLTIKDGYSNGGVGMAVFNCDATFRNLKIINNISTAGLGAGMSLYNSNSTFIQVLVSNNTSLLSPGGDGDTAGIRITGGTTKFYNCVVANNHAEGFIGGIWLSSNTNSYFYNSIIYGNTADVQFDSSTNDNFMTQNNVNFYASNCILQGCRGSDYLYGTPQFAVYGNDLGKNLDVNPLFNTDYSLQSSSLGINEGDNQAFNSAANSVNKDFFNNNRIVDVIDIGLSEFQVVQPDILYVRQNGTGDGSSWANASGNLQFMMDKQLEGKSVYVGQGTYIAPAPYFKLRNKVKVYGGFAPTGNPTFESRNSELYPTILTSVNYAIIGNYHPADKKLSSETSVDGFTITKNANSPSTMFGIFETNSDVSYSNDIFTGLTYTVAQLRENSVNSFTNCTFSDNINSSDQMGNIMLHFGARASFLRCDFIHNFSFVGPAISLKNNSYAIVEDCLFRENNNNAVSSAGKVFVIQNSSASITNSVFDSNGDSSTSGSSLLIDGTPDPIVDEWTHPVTVTVDRCVFKNNLNEGIIIAGKASDKISISNSLFYGNTGNVGAGITKGLDGDLYITNCTITENHASNQWGGGVFFSEGHGNNYIRNSIIYNNTSVYTYAPELWTFQPISFKNTLIRTSGGSSNWDGGAFNNFDIADLSTDLGGNLDVNPLFVNAASENYELQELSPVINAGSNAFYNAGGIPDLSIRTTDLAGNMRIQQSIIDMGAYEFEPNLSTNPVDSVNGISIYPNPSEGLVTVRSLDSDTKQIKLYSILGKELMTSQNEAIDLSGLTNGIYFVKVTLDNNKIYTTKLIKK